MTSELDSQRVLIEQLIGENQTLTQHLEVTVNKYNRTKETLDQAKQALREYQLLAKEIEYLKQLQQIQDSNRSSD